MQKPSGKKQSGLLAVIFLAWYFPDSQPNLCYFCLISYKRRIVLWHHRSQMKQWYIVASSSGESIFADGVDEPRQNLMLRLSYLLAPMACIIYSHTSPYKYHDKNPIKADESFSFVLFSFQSKNPKQQDKGSKIH